MLVAGDITPADFVQKVRMNPLGLFAFPSAREDVDFVPARRDGQSCREAVLLQAAERIVIIEHETDFHSPASEPEVNFAAMRKVIVNGDAVLAVVLPLHRFRPFFLRAIGLAGHRFSNAGTVHP